MYRQVHKNDSEYDRYIFKHVLHNSTRFKELWSHYLVVPAPAISATPRLAAEQNWGARHSPLSDSTAKRHWQHIRWRGEKTREKETKSSTTAVGSGRLYGALIGRKWANIQPNTSKQLLQRRNEHGGVNTGNKPEKKQLPNGPSNGLRDI